MTNILNQMILLIKRKQNIQTEESAFQCLIIRHLDFNTEVLPFIQAIWVSSYSI